MSFHNADLTQDYFELGWNVWKSNFECFQNGARIEQDFKTPVDKSKGY